MTTEFKVGDRVRLNEKAKESLGFLVGQFGAERKIVRLVDRSPYETPLAFVDGNGVGSIDTGWLEHVPTPALIDPAKKYRTRDGREVRIYATDGGGAFPTHGAILFGAQWSARTWTASGEHNGPIARDLDLVEVKPERSGWVNVYDSQHHKIIDSGLPTAAFAGTNIYANRADADARAEHAKAHGRNRIACLRLTFREGDGLEGK